MSAHPSSLLLPCFLCAALLLPGLAAQAAQTEVFDIRIGLNPGHSRVVFDLSSTVHYHVDVLEHPDRVVIDLENTLNTVDIGTIPLRGTPIVRIATERQNNTTQRYIIEVGDNTDAEVFALKPYQTRGHRLVLDLIAVKPAASEQANLPVEGPQSSATSAPAPAIAEDQRSARVTAPGIPTPSPTAAPAGEWSGYFSLDARLFPDSPAYPQQADQNFSTAFQPEYYLDWADGRQAFALRAFFRYDANDDQRTHADARELYWRVEYEQLVFKAGLDVVFWGVAESQHLVDIINQTDLVENIDGEEKLGQPMLNLDYLTEWGAWQFYVLPYFRERTFPGEYGRLRTNPEVDTRHPQYQSGSKQEHVDFALRWSHYLGDWDIGLAHFSGTSREPYLMADNSGGKLKLIPLYLQIDQTSLDAQATKGAWLWKLEALYNQNRLQDYYAYVGGFERTSFGVADTPLDLGVLLEYHYDERGDEATNGLQSDIYLGLRLTANDTASTMVLLGLLYDTDTHSLFGNIEASRRLTEYWTLGLELRFTTNADEHENLFFIKADDYLGIELTRYF